MKPHLFKSTRIRDRWCAVWAAIPLPYVKGNPATPERRVQCTGPVLYGEQPKEAFESLMIDREWSAYERSRNLLAEEGT